MGLHAQIHQNHQEVQIALRGCFGCEEVDQLRAIVRHFRGRGCNAFTLDLSRVAPMTGRAQASLQRLLGTSDSQIVATDERNCALRRSADLQQSARRADCW